MSLVSLINRAIVLRRYPTGAPQADDFELIERTTSELKEGEVLVETHFLSMDPAPRMRMDCGSKFPPPLLLGQVVVGRGVGIVRESRSAEIRPGETVAGELGWQEYAVAAAISLRKIDEKSGPMQASLGVLGPSGITAWFLTHEASTVRAGDTVVIGASAGSVGSVALQLARLAGARTVGIVGGARQARFVRDDLGADAVVDYQSGSLGAELAAACPGGANVFLDSIGGALHNAVMAHIADHARIVVFGYISAYNMSASTLPEYGSIYQVIRRRAHLRGFLIGDYVARFPEAVASLSNSLMLGKIKNFEHCVDGLDNAPAAFAALFTGEPIGKQLVQVRAKKLDPEAK